ncbi:MAG TPA: hypothetical protein VGJ48_18780 [Pyrinomonadaceae bacterium]
MTSSTTPALKTFTEELNLNFDKLMVGKVGLPRWFLNGQYGEIQKRKEYQ